MAADKGQKNGSSTVVNSGVLSATGYASSGGSSPEASAKGGSISVLADNVGILSGSVIDTSGGAGGGTIRIGGDFHGEGDTPTALHTIVQSGAIINADALTSGDGGHVTVWADEWTQFAGNTRARGGAISGDGGFVETSGKQTLSATGVVDASAPGGHGGTWLLDPSDLTITASTTTGTTTSSGANPITWATTAGSNQDSMSAATIVSELNAGTNVVIQTSNTGSGGNGDITVGSAISATTGTGGVTGALTLSAYRNIVVNAAITEGSAGTVTGGGITLRADNAGNGSGYINVAANIATNGGAITLGGGSGAISAGTGYAYGNSGQAYGILLNNTTLNAGGGNIIMNGTGYATSGNFNYGIYMVNAAVAQTSGSGTIALTGTGGGSGASAGNAGVYMNGNGLAAKISAANGNTTITGTGGSTTGSGNYGVRIDSGAIAETTGTGTLTLNGTGGGTGASINNYGVFIGNNSGIVRSTGTNGGGITITGNGGDAGGSGTDNYGVFIASIGTAATVSTVDGNISITGTGGNASGNNNIGIYNLYTWLISSTGNGTITLNGTGGGNSGTGAYSQGVQLASGGKITSQKANISITGTGATSPNYYNYGVEVDNGAVVETTGTATVNITGQGGGSGAYYYEYGVDIDTGGIVRSTAAGGGSITIAGTGGDTGGTGGSSHGVIVQGANSLITSVDGAINVNGTGGSGSGGGNDGVIIYNGGGVTSTGSAAINLTGIKGSGGSSYDIYTSTGSNVFGGGSDTGNITFNADTLSMANFTAQTTGTILFAPRTASTTIGVAGGAGTLQVTGSSGILDSLTAGEVDIGRTDGTGAMAVNAYTWGNSAKLMTGSGLMTIAGAQVMGAHNLTLQTDSDLTLSAAISGTGALTIKPSSVGTTMELGGTGQTLNLSATEMGRITSGWSSETFGRTDGTGAITVDANTFNDTTNIYGGNITVSGALTAVKNLTLGSNGNITDNSTITKSSGADATLTMNATGDIVVGSGDTISSSSNKLNVLMDADSDASGAGAISVAGNITTNGGNITLGGGANAATTAAVGDASYAAGVTVASLNAGGGNISLIGTGYTGGVNTASAYGVLSNSGTIQTNSGGIITMTGQSGGTGSGGTNYGVWLHGTTTSAVNGNITITGTGGNNAGSANDGIILSTSGTVQSGGSGNYGMHIGGNVQSTASSGGGVTIIGYSGNNGGGGSGSNWGIWFTSGTISSVDGNILIEGNTGTGHAVSNVTAGGNAGVVIGNSSGATISSTGNATITVNGVGAGSGSGANNMGVWLIGTSTITSINSDINITGTGANTTGGGDNGIWLHVNPIVKTTGSGNITFTGTGGGGNTDIYSYNSSGNNQIGGSSDTGNITFDADTINFANTTPIQTTGNVYFAPRTASTLIGVDGGAGTLGITSGILAGITASNLIIGDGTNSGLITMSATDLSARNYGLTVNGTGGVALNGNVTTNNKQVTFNNAVTLGAASTINSGTAPTTLGAVNAQAWNFGVTADDVALGGNLSGTGALSLQPYSASTVMRLNDGAGGFNLSSTELGYIANGSFSGVTIGSTSGTGAVNVGAETPGANTTLQSGSGNITFDGIQTLGAHSLSATTSGNITLAQNAKIVSTANSGNSIVLAAGGNFINNDSNDGSGALNAGTGTARYLVYSTDPSLNTMSGLSDAGKHIFNKTYAGYAPGSVTQTGNLFLYSLAPTITVTADNQSRLYGQSNPTLTYTLSGLVDGDTSSILTGSPTISTTATATTGVGSYTITSALNNLANSLGYQLTTANGTLTISKAHLTVTADNKSMTYGGGSLPGLTDTITGYQNGEGSGVLSGSASLSTAATAYNGTAGSGSNAGAYTITAGNGTLSAANYDFTPANGTLTVGKAVLTATADNQARLYGAANPAFTETVSGYQNGDTASILTGTATGSSTATTTTGVGTATITGSTGTLGVNDGNYTFAAANGTLTISKAHLTVTADNKSMTYGGGSLPGLTDTITGYQNGEGSGVLSGSASLSTAATAYNGMAGSGSNAGSYTITAAANNLAAANYDFAYANGTLTVGKAILTATADARSKTYGAALPSLSYQYSGLVNGDTSSVFSGGLTTPATASSNVGTYAINQGTLAAGGNYTIGYTGNTLTVNPASLTVTADAKSKTYGAALPSLTYRYTGLVNGDTSSVFSGGLTTPVTASSNAGSYAINQGTLAAGGNYSIGYTGANLTVTAALLPGSGEAVIAQRLPTDVAAMAVAMNTTNMPPPLSVSTPLFGAETPTGAANVGSPASPCEGLGGMDSTTCPDAALSPESHDHQ